MSELWDTEPDEGQGAGPLLADLDAERILAASVMAKTDLVDDLPTQGFDPADITDARYRWIWFAAEELHTGAPGRSEGRPRNFPWEAVDRVLQAWHAEGRMPVVPLTGIQLSELYVGAMPGSASWAAERITAMAVRARMQAHGHSSIIRARSAAFDPATDVAAAQAELDAVTGSPETSTVSLLGDLLDDVFQRAVTKPTIEDRIPTGFLDLDACTSGGWAPGQLVVVGARPAMGKTTFAAGLARAAAIKNGIPTLFESLEMSKAELANGIVCAEARVALHHVKQGIVDDAGVARMTRGLDRMQAAPLMIHDSALLTMPALRGRVRHLVRTAGLRLVIIDYLQLMQAPKAESRQVAVAEMSRGLKLLAKEFQITVVVLAQLNRGPEQRTEKRPIPSDLRESGAIEQDADIVILLHREDAYERESPRAGEADVIIGKHRGGTPGTFTTAFQGHYARFVDMAET